VSRSRSIALGFLALAVSARAASDARAEPSKGGRYVRIHVIDFEDAIEPALTAYAERRLDDALEAKADLVVLRIESPGGRVDVTKELADRILSMKGVRTLAWIPAYAYSGAAIVAIACDEIVMSPKAILGDAQPGVITQEGWRPVGEKAESPIRAWVRAYAEDNGYPALLAQKMVSESLEVVLLESEDGRRVFALGSDWSDETLEVFDGYRRSDLRRERTFPKGQLLTMTAQEALDFGFASRLVDTERELLASLSAPGAVVTYHAMTASEKAGRWLLGIAGILIGLVLLGVGFTIFQGIGIPSFVAAGALVLVLLVFATADLAHGFPIFLVALGLILLLVEAFLVPGFGIPGILGAVLFAGGMLFLATGFRPGEPETLDPEGLRTMGLQLVVTLLVAGATLVVLARVFPGMPLFRGALLPAGAMPSGAAFTAGPRTGDAVAVTALRPAGRASLGGDLVDVVSEGGFVEAGTPLRVVRVEGNRVVVRPA
jgi:membrane-bound serine protease (ClpP class)